MIWYVSHRVEILAGNLTGWSPFWTQLPKIKLKKLTTLTYPPMFIFLCRVIIRRMSAGVSIWVDARACICACVDHVCVWLWCAARLLWAWRYMNMTLCACVCFVKIYKYAVDHKCARACVHATMQEQSPTSSARACVCVVFFTWMYKHAGTIFTRYWMQENVWQWFMYLCACAYLV